LRREKSTPLGRLSGVSIRKVHSLWSTPIGEGRRKKAVRRLRVQGLPAMSRSPAQIIGALPEAEQAAALAKAFPTEAHLARAKYEWRFWARPEQAAPLGDWRVWLLLAGRGFGKTRAGVEWVRETKERVGRIHLVARTGADVRDVLVEGESGILATAPPWDRPKWEPSKRRLTWPNGAVATTFSADEPDQLRGPQCEAALADELAAWRFPDAWDQLLLGCRIGTDPRVVAMTTPRPTPIIRGLLKLASTAVSRGGTRENAGNLAPGWIDAIESKYAGSRLGRQELDGEVLDDAPGALWKLAQIDAARVRQDPSRLFRAIVVAVDPSVKEHAPGATDESGDECGIIVVGLGYDSHAYVLDDRSGIMGPAAWAAAAVSAFDDWQANTVVCEVNQGGALVTHTLRSVRQSLPIVTVHAKRAKVIRAEPVAVLAEQGRVHHVGVFSALEDEITTWEPGDKESPNRLDALVYAVTHHLPSYQGAAAKEERAARPPLPVDKALERALVAELKQSKDRRRILVGGRRR
jgi:phage terminase large subunit-like protein